MTSRRSIRRSASGPSLPERPPPCSALRLDARTDPKLPPPPPPLLLRRCGGEESLSKTRSGSSLFGNAEETKNTVTLLADAVSI